MTKYSGVELDAGGLQFRIVNPIVDSKQWDSMILLSPDYSVFHSSSWARVLMDTYGYDPHYMVCLRGDKPGMLLPMMELKNLVGKRRGVSLPFSDYCEPLVFDHAIFPKMFEQAVALATKHKWKYLEFKGGQEFFEPESYFARYWGHILDLKTSLDSVFSGFRDSTRRNILKAEKEGVGTEILNSLSAVKGFYRLHCSTRKHQGVPPQPWAFFESIYRHLISAGYGFVVRAMYQDEVIAGAIFLHFGNKAMYKFGASKREKRNLRPNNLVIWRAIQSSCERGYESLCFGKTDIENEGLRRFKNGWGANEYAINYYKYDLSRQAFSTETGMRGDLCGSLFKRMPEVTLKIIGRLAYKYFG